MPLNTEQLFAHLKATAGKAPAKPKLPRTPAIQQAKRKEQEAKRAIGADRLEKEANNAVNTQDARQVAEHSLSKTLMKKLIEGVKLTTDEQRQIAMICRQAGLL